MITFNLETVRRDLKEIADADPAFVYPTGQNGGCYYFVDDKPSCIIGQMLARHGVSAESLKDLQNSQKIYSLNKVTDLFTFDQDAVQYADDVQNMQDVGISWANAVKFAEDRALGRES